MSILRLTQGVSTLPAQALALYSERSVDLILSDIIMPGMNGPEFTSEWVRKNPTTRVAFMSGYADDSIHQIPPSELLQKPFTPSELFESSVRSSHSADSTRKLIFFLSAGS